MITKICINSLIVYIYHVQIFDIGSFPDIDTHFRIIPFQCFFSDFAFSAGLLGVSLIRYIGESRGNGGWASISVFSGLSIVFLVAVTHLI